MEAAGQQVTEAGTGRAARPLRRHLRGPARGVIAGLGGPGGAVEGRCAGIVAGG